MTEVLMEICRINQVFFPADDASKLEEPYKDSQNENQSKNIIAKLIELKLMRTSIFLVLIWMFISLGYNSFNSFIPIFMKAKGFQISL